MGRSFVLRQPGGALAGYMIANRDALQLRASGIPATGGELTLVDTQGMETRRSLHSTEQEQTLGGTGGEITAVYAIGGGRVLFASDVQALRTAESALAGRVRNLVQVDRAQRKRPAQEDAQYPGVSAAENSGGRSGQKRSESILKEESRRRGEMLEQRRWPPPPCLMGARYVGGRWVTAKRAAPDTPGAPPHCGET